MLTVLELGAQTPLEMVHCKTYVTPGVPVKPLVLLLASAKLPPAPLTILQSPAPTAGAFAFSVVNEPQTV